MTTEAAIAATPEEGNVQIETSRMEPGSNIERHSASSPIQELAAAEAEATPKFPKSVEKYMRDGKVDVEQLTKGYDELSTKLRSTRPSAPASVDEYTFDFPEGFIVDEATTTEFKQQALEKGLSTDQYQWIMSEYLSSIAGMQTATVDAAESTLRENWGDHYDDNLASAQTAWTEFGKDLDIDSIGNNPIVLEILARVGKTMAEDGIAGGVRAQPENVGLSDKEIQDLMDHPQYHNSLQLQDKVAEELGRRRKLGLPMFRPV